MDKHENKVKSVIIKPEECKSCVWAMKQEGYIVCPFIGCMSKSEKGE